MSGQAQVYMVMGVSGVGKTTIAQEVTKALNGTFLEADDFHPQVNVDHMAEGKPLTDEMRWPWLKILCSAVSEQRESAPTVPVIVTCSALKKTYRDLIRDLLGDVRFVYLHAEAEVIRTRMAARTDHYMPLTLLDSQLATLEDPRGELGCLTVDADQDTAGVIAAVLAEIEVA